MKSSIATIKRHPIITFFALAYILSWLPWVLGTLAPTTRAFLPYPFLASGPLLAALVVIPVTRGRAGLRAFGQSFLRWRVEWHWYAAAIGIPLAVAFGATILNSTLGAPSRTLAQIMFANGDAQDLSSLLSIGPLFSMVLVFLLRLINPADGPMGEEPGWRGYAQPGLQRSMSPLVAASSVGLLAAGWHLPIILIGAASPFELVAPFCLGIVSSWIYNRTRGSLLLSIALHAADGLIQIESLGYTGLDAERMAWLYSGLWCVMAIGVTIVAGAQLGRQPTVQGDSAAVPVAAT